MLNVNETVTSIKPCYKIRYLSLKIWRYAESPYLCNVFFIVLDLRLTKVGVQRNSFFYALIFPSPKRFCVGQRKNLRTSLFRHKF